MSGPQFIHLQSFAIKKNSIGQSVAQILGEAARAPEFSGHVQSPLPPRILFGITPVEVQEMHDQLVERGGVDVTLANGKVARRGIRKDRHTLMTAVASHPFLSIQVAEGGEHREAYELWVQLNLNWLKSTFGDRLVSVVEHLDEPHAHIHAYILPLDDPGCFARNLNPAWRAKEAAEALARKSGHTPKAAVRLGDAAYKAGGREVQDDYHQKVGMLAGLTRIGPKRTRLSRAEWKAKKEDAKRAAAMLRDMDQRVEVIASAQASLDSDADRMAEEISVKLELAETILEDAQRMRIQAEQMKSSITADAHRTAAEVTREERQELAAKQSAVEAEDQRIRHDRLAFDEESRKLRRNTFQECVSVALRVILGVISGDVCLSSDRTEVKIADERLSEAVNRLEIRPLLRAIVGAVETVWNRLTGQLSKPEVKAEQQNAEQVLSPFAQRPKRGLEP